jgi:hypothetical protein
MLLDDRRQATGGSVHGSLLRGLLPFLIERI